MEEKGEEHGAMSSDDANDQILAKLDKIESQQKAIELQLKELNLIVYGSDRLGVPPLLQQVRELYKFYDRAKWVAGALGASNVGLIITWVITNVGRSIP